MLVVFSGPHTYISASWYRTLLTAAQVRGRLTPIDDDEGQLAVLRRVAAVLERDDEKPWTQEQAPPGKVQQQLLPGIRPFRITRRAELRARSGHADGFLGFNA